MLISLFEIVYSKHNVFLYFEEYSEKVHLCMVRNLGGGVWLPVKVGDSYTKKLYSLLNSYHNDSRSTIAIIVGIGIGEPID